MKILEESQQYKDGHYQVGLLWHPGVPNLKSNYQQALKTSNSETTNAKG